MAIIRPKIIFFFFFSGFCSHIPKLWVQLSPGAQMMLEGNCSYVGNMSWKTTRVWKDSGDKLLFLVIYQITLKLLIELKRGSAIDLQILVT